MQLNSSEKTAVISGNTRLSYSQFMGKVAIFSKEIPKNTKKVALFAENSLQWTYIFFATWARNSVAVPIDFLSSASEVAHILSDCRPEIVFFSEKTEETLKKAVGTLKNDYRPEIKKITKEDHTEEEVEKPVIKMKDTNETAVIIYTSGTTGLPKGVMLSFRNLSANIKAVTEEVPFFNAETRTLAFLPLHHVYPLMGSLLAPLFSGGTVALSPSMETEDIIKTLNDGKVTIIIGVPRFYELLKNALKKKIQKSIPANTMLHIASVLSSPFVSRKLFKKIHTAFGGHIKFLISGGAKLDENTSDFFTTLGFNIIEGYGTTETAPMISFPRMDEYVRGSVGKPLFDNSVKLENGEVLVKGPHVMKGYYNSPEKTAEVIRNGWLHTGDLARFDEKGNIFITGRKKEMIVTSNGKNINPLAMEEKIMSMTGLLEEVAVLYHEGLLLAVIRPDMKEIRKKHLQNIEDTVKWEIIDPYNTSVPSYRRIQRFHLIYKPLPRTRLEKLKRHEIPGMISNKKRAEKVIDEPQYEEYDIVREFLSERTEEPVFPDDHIEIDIGMDSLEKVKLQSFIKNTFGLEIGEKEFGEYPTVRKLSAFLKEKKEYVEKKAVNWYEVLKEEHHEEIPKSGFFHLTTSIILKIGFNLFFKTQVKGRNNILKKRPVIFAANHQSFIDAFLLNCTLPHSLRRKTYFFAKEKHFQGKLKKWAAGNSNVILISASRTLKSSIQKMAKVLKEGGNMVIFPEGTRSPDGDVKEFRETFSILAKELEIPVIPVAIDGTFNAFPKHKKLPAIFRRLSVSFLTPVYPEDYSYEAISNKVRSRITESMN